jgi:RND family efflux transporter MFP subunit
LNKWALYMLGALIVGLAPAFDGKFGFAQVEGGGGRVPVRVFQVGARDFSSTISAMGTINYWAKADVSSEIEGRLASVKVEEGDRVEKGQIVALIDSSLLEAQLRRAKADVEVAEIDLAKTENEVRKAASRLEAARIAMEKSKGIFERFQKLSDLGVSSEVEMDRAEIAYENSVAAYEVSNEDYRALQTKSNQGRIESEARLLKARAEFEMIRLRLEKCTIRAPIAGIVASRKKWSGENIDPRDPVILTIMDVEEVFAEVDVSERNLGAVKAGQKSTVRADAYPEMEFAGVVHSLSPTVDFNSRTVKVRIRVPNEKQLLRPGIFVRVDIVLEAVDGALVVPQEAVISSDDGRQRVFVVFEEVAFQREVQTGLKKDGWVVVLKGVRDGERVVVEGQERLRDLAAVQSMEIRKP